MEQGQKIRKIVHIDMDAFFASVEQRDNPDLRGKPIAVGGSKERGVVAAASYEARVFGVRSAMASITARHKCPDLVFVKPRFDVYRAVSLQIREIFLGYTKVMEPLSLDEAYLDVTNNLKNIPLANDVAKEIRREIFDRTNLTASAGISYNKFLAKIASDQRKPNGQFSIPPEKGEAFIEKLLIGKFHGIGPATERKMHQLNILTGADLKSCTLAFLQHNFGKSGEYFYQIARGIDNRPVCPDRQRKSIGAETTFSYDLHNYEEAWANILPLIEKVSIAAREKSMQARTVVLKVKYSDFVQITRSFSITNATNEPQKIKQIIEQLLRGIFPLPKSVRLLGVTLANLEELSEVEKQGTLGMDF